MRPWGRFGVPGSWTGPGNWASRSSTELDLGSTMSAICRFPATTSSTRSSTVPGHTRRWQTTLFFWPMRPVGVCFSSRLCRVCPSRYPASFWLNVATTMLILLGPAVEDSANGKDVYAAFLVRLGLFVAVTLYAWLAIYFLEWLRARRASSGDTASHSVAVTNLGSG